MKQLYAIVRFDLPIHYAEPQSSIAVVKILSSQEIAEGEAERLNQLNKDKGCIYHVFATRCHDKPDETKTF